MPRLRLPLSLFLAAALAVLAAVASQAQVLELRAYRVTFPAGSIGTTVRETIVGAETILYRVAARKGQVLQVNLDAGSASLVFSVYGPGRGPGDAALATSNQLGATVPALNRFQGSLAADGDYTIALSLVRAAANRGDRVPFTLGLKVTAGAVQLPGGPAVPDRPQAGFLRVSGVKAGDRLNVRSGPAVGQPVIYSLADGAVVRNLGCERNSAGAVWCRVQTLGPPGLTGWASASYLVETRDPGSATPLPEAPRPPAPVTSSGRIACVLEWVPLECAYRVTRRGRGDATLSVTRPFTRDRVIEFLAGRPVSSNASVEVFGEWKGDSVIVSFGPKESYTVPNAVLFGR